MTAPPRLREYFNLRKNVKFAVGEFALNMGLLFVGYRLLIQKGGLEDLGIWATLYAWTNFVRIGDAGVSGAATRFLSMWSAETDRAEIRRYGETALIINTFQFAALALLAYLVVSPNVRNIVGPQHENQGRHILPWLTASFFLLNLSGTLLSMLQGLHLGYVRSQLSVAGTVLQLICVVLLVPTYGLTGYALAQIVQYTATAVVAWSVVRSALRCGPVPTDFNKAACREMLGYSLKAQAVNISNGLVEPLSKMLVGHFGGMANQGLFELAYKTVLAPRNLVAAGVSAATPTMTSLFRNDRHQLRVLYARALRLASTAMGVAVVCTLLLAPAASRLWLGRVDTSYWLYVALLAFGFLLNVVGVPAYLLGMASGSMRNNLSAALGSLLLLGGSGWVLGSALGATGAAAASAISIGVCGAAICIANRNLIAG